MTIVGLGVDLVDIEHFKRLSESDDATLDRMFTQREVAALSSGVRRGEQLAGRFSAKEAVLKALGVGQSQGVAWTDIEITTSGVGAPSVTLSGRAEVIAKDRHVDEWLISISHTATCATATAIGLTVGRPDTS